MKIRPLAIVKADFPDDSIEDDNDIVQFEGRGVATVLAEMLRRAGYVVTEPEHQHEHGWDFYAEIGKRRFWFQVQIADECYISSAIQNWFSFRKINKRAYAAALATLNSGMKADPRFRDILWHSKLSPPGEVGWKNPVAEV